MAKILDGKAISASIKEGIRVRVQELEAIYGQRPALAVVIVGSDPASCSYVHSKVAAAEYLGIHNLQVELPETASEQEVLDAIRSLNENRDVDGILVQLPLPRGIDEEKVIEAVSYEKDVDGFHPMNVAHLWMGGKNMKPCTPKGIMRLLDESGIEISGKRAVVVGRSNIVGKPVAKLLLDRNATVTIAHSRSADLGAVTREADILVSAVGRPGMITADMIKPGAVVIDVGTTRGEDGKLHGDVDFEAAREVAGWITPVPGGVGPMTIAMLMENTLECFVERMTGEKAGNREIKPFVANLTGVLGMLLDFTYLLKGFLIGICAAIPLGPVAMLVIQKTLTEGRKAGFSCGLGCSVADCIFACISGLALYTAGQFIEKNTVSIQIIGGIILIGIGMIMFFSRIRETKERGHSYDPLNFVKAMMMCLTNPGALAIMLGLFAFFRMDMSEIPLFLRVLTLVSVFFGSVSYWYLFSSAVNKLGYRFPFRLLVTLNRVFGIVVVVCGIVLAAKVFI